jgi:hypothetical protein
MVGAEMQGGQLQGGHDIYNDGKTPTTWTWWTPPKSTTPSSVDADNVGVFGRCSPRWRHHRGAPSPPSLIRVSISMGENLNSSCGRSGCRQRHRCVPHVVSPWRLGTSSIFAIFLCLEASQSARHVRGSGWNWKLGRRLRESFYICGDASVRSQSVWTPER